MSPITKVMMKSPIQLANDLAMHGSAFVGIDGERIEPISVSFSLEADEATYAMWYFGETEDRRGQYYVDYSTHASLDDESAWTLMCMSGSQEDHADAQVWFRDVEEDYLEARWRGRS